jgi:7-carboxy-7-deazaguanine synthase
LSLLKVTEIYLSVQGESSFAGLPCVFIRMTGCPLRCRWCDTVYSFEGGEDQALSEIIEGVQSYKTNLVELTGGEPLAQPASYELIRLLCDKGFKVLIETSGAEPIEAVDRRAHVIMDIKCPGSKMEDRNRYENILALKKTDEIKFVIADRADYEWARNFIRDRELDKVCHLLLSPAFGLVAPKDLVDWLLEDHLPVRLNMQLHKYIWHPRKKGV